MPAGPEIRPTLDITRKAIFDILGESVIGARFLDIYAGTGANGIEALSRGAGFALFVDRSAFCIKVIKENLEKTFLIEKAKVIRADAVDFLERLDKQSNPYEQKYDIVFADPPYDKNFPKKSAEMRNNLPENRESQAKKTLQLLSTGSILSQNSLVVIEHSPETKMPDNEGILKIWKQRKYGSTMVSFYHKRL